MRTLAYASALACALLAMPMASALDVLPTEVRFGDLEARILVRAAESYVRVDAEPPVVAAASAPEGARGAFAPTPRTLTANATWHGLDRIVVIVLHRADARSRVDVMIDDGAQAGVWLEWPAVTRALPLGPLALAGIAIALVLRPRRM